jgi:hypothetical protein
VSESYKLDLPEWRENGIYSAIIGKGIDGTELDNLSINYPIDETEGAYGEFKSDVYIWGCVAQYIWLSEKKQVTIYSFLTPSESNILFQSFSIERKRK